MLKKLLKYDLKYMIKNMSVFYILALVASILTRIIFSLKETVIINIAGQICLGFMFSMIASILINTIMRSWVRFRDSIYKDEAYLTHTLPVSKNDIYNSKFLQTIIFFGVSMFFVILSIFITYYTKERWDILIGLFNKINLSYNTKVFLMISIVIVFMLEIFNIIQSGFLGIILGYKANNYKTGYSVFWGLIVYIISQLIALLFLFITGLINKNIFRLFISTDSLTPGIVKPLVVLAIIFYLFIIIMMNIVCKKVLKKGVNIE